jgi:type I restriction-modification system DNA methylase subunit
MQTKNRNTYTTIHTEGALLPIDLLQRISDNDPNLPGLTPESYHLAPGEKINEAINRSWNRLSGLWTAFQNALQKLPEGDFATTLTRERWLLPLFQELGYGRLSTARAVEIEGKSYAISHGWDSVPIHLVGANIKLDRATPGAAGAARTNPHSLMQEYLNRTPGLQWGILSNGLSLRILRDNATLTRQAYLEFELESMFNGEVYADFVLLWLICHQSRFETSEKQTDCLLESWSKNAQEGGTRALEALREGVEKAIITLGQGFLQHRLNNELRTHLKSGELSAQDYYRQLLRLVYRLIFLFTAEDRELLLLPDAALETKQHYENYYSTTRLRQLAERQRGSRHHDRYEALCKVMEILGSSAGYPALGLPALGGFLFDPTSAADINNAKLDNQSLLTAVRWLSSIREGNTRRIVDYRNLGPEELGSVYESLLELHPLLNTDAGSFDLSSAAGNERKTTGSYYTPTSLIKVLLDSALDPVIEDRVKVSGHSPSEQEAALLDLNVCDPACGSGHFLIAAAHRIANKLAQVRSGGDEPSPEETRHALRDVIRHCIYGVDLNPMAVELCKVNLWLESIEPGKPLTFLDAHIKCGNSLVGVGPKMDINELTIPDDAFKPVTGDHKPTAALLRKRNKQEREGQESLFVTVLKNQEDLDGWLAQRAQAIEDMPEEDAKQVQAKARAFEKINQSEQYLKQRQIADLWTATFFWQIKEPGKNELSILAPTHGQLQRFSSGKQVQDGLLSKVNDLRINQNFFHWSIEFADVHASGGFNCVLGNPPWERIKLQEEEFFAFRDPEIANAPNKAARGKLIKKLKEENPLLALEFENAKHAAECASKFMRTSIRYPLSAVGDMNTYALFAEHFYAMISNKGRLGIIVPIGIATDDTTKDFFANIVEQGQIEKIIGFENESFIFSEIHHSTKFCCLVIRGERDLNKPADFIFFCRYINQLSDISRHFQLTPADIARINPNTRTSPIFRTKVDADLTNKTYQMVPILINERTQNNPWNLSFLRMFDMSNDSGLFIDEPNPNFLKLYEAKMIWQFDHRYTSFEYATQENLNSGILPQCTEKQKQDPSFNVMPRYWVPTEEVERRLKDWKHEWLVGFRNITSSVVERTSIFSVLPKVGVGHSMPILFSTVAVNLFSCLLANFCTLVFDYFVRQKLGGVNMTYGYLRQFPVISPPMYNNKIVEYINSRVVELVYTSNDLKSFAKDIGYNADPFCWDEDRRAILRAELDAYYAALYSLNRDELRYILDPQDVYGPDFPGETFRVLKEKEIRQYGEYRTRRLVLEAWDRLEASGELPKPAYENQEPIQPISQSTSQPAQPEKIETNSPKPAKKSEPGPTPLLDFAAANPQVEETPSTSHVEYGLYKCGSCGAMVMSFDLGNHEKEKHGGNDVEWRKIG